MCRVCHPPPRQARDMWKSKMKMIESEDFEYTNTTHISFAIYSMSGMDVDPDDDTVVLESKQLSKEWFRKFIEWVDTDHRYAGYIPKNGMEYMYLSPTLHKIFEIIEQNPESTTDEIIELVKPVIEFDRKCFMGYHHIVDVNRLSRKIEYRLVYPTIALFIMYFAYNAMGSMMYTT